jgi:hypothetical protein
MAVAATTALAERVPHAIEGCAVQPVVTSEYFKHARPITVDEGQDNSTYRYDKNLLTQMHWIDHFGQQVASGPALHKLFDDAGG